MSEKSTKTETLSINTTICFRTDDDDLVCEFLDDIKELFNEWHKKVQITNMNVAIHDHRIFHDYIRTFEDPSKLSDKDPE